MNSPLVEQLCDTCFCWFPAAMLVTIRMGTNIASPYKAL